jgi:hypothetical protein
VALPFTLKRILRQKKGCGKSNISPCKNMIFKKSSKRNQNPSRYYHSRTNFKFQHKPNLSTISLPWQARPKRIPMNLGSQIAILGPKCSKTY